MIFKHVDGDPLEPLQRLLGVRGPHLVFILVQYMQKYVLYRYRIEIEIESKYRIESKSNRF